MFCIHYILSPGSRFILSRRTLKQALINFNVCYFYTIADFFFLHNFTICHLMTHHITSTIKVELPSLSRNALVVTHSVALGPDKNSFFIACVQKQRVALSPRSYIDT